MANRSHLYSVNKLPVENGWDRSCTKFVGILEWAYDVPLVQKILMSSNPQVAPSAIFETNDQIAIVSDFEPGSIKLFHFLERIQSPLIGELRDEAIEYLNDPRHRNPYFLLEPGEIFELGPEEDFKKAIRDLLEEIQNVEETMEHTIETLNNPKEAKRESFFKKLFSRQRAMQRKLDRLLAKNRPLRPKDPKQHLYDLGLGNWTEVQFYDPNGSD